MHPLGLASLLLLSAVALAAAVHLLSLWRRTRKLPELFLALSFIFGVFGNGVIVIVDADLVEVTHPVAVTQIGAMILNVGFAFAVVFVAYVYHLHSRWAQGLALFVTGGLFAAQAWAWALDIASDEYLPLFIVKFAFRASAYAWSAFEAMRYYRLMLRRVRYGIADPVVANRFALWGVASFLSLLMLTGMQMVRWFGFETTAGDIALTVGSLAGAPAAALFWLTFFPPQRYRAFVERYSSNRGRAT